MNGINIDLLTKIRNNRRKDRYQIQKLIDKGNFYSIVINRLPITYLESADMEKMKQLKKNWQIAKVNGDQIGSLIPLTLYYNYKGPIDIEEDDILAINKMGNCKYKIALNTKIEKPSYEVPIEYRLYNLETKKSLPVLKITPKPVSLHVDYTNHNPYTNQKDYSFFDDPFNKIIDPLKINGYSWQFEVYTYGESFDPTFPLSVDLGIRYKSYNVPNHCYPDIYYTFTKNLWLKFNDKFDDIYLDKF